MGSNSSNPQIFSTSMLQIDQNKGAKIGLYNLPPELVGLIAQMSGARAVGNLWCCGSRRLNFIISSPIFGLRIYELCAPYTGLIAPRFIKELQGLKEIFIRSKEASQPNLSADFAYQHFCSTIETMSIQSPNCLSMWMKQSKFFILRTPPTCLDFGTSFPCLSTLELDFSGQGRDKDRDREAEHLSILLGALPLTLTSLSLVGHADQRDLQPVPLPVNLTELTMELSPFFDFDLVFALPQLQKLSLPSTKVSFYSPTKFMQIPSLTHLHTPQISSSLGDTLLTAFPNLTYLSGFERQIVSQPNLRHLICALNKAIPTTLPQNLTTLTLYGVVNLPKQLEKPITECKYLSTLNLDVIRCPPRDVFSSLPSTVTTLTCSWKGSGSDFFRKLPATLLHFRFLRTDLMVPTNLLPKTLLSVTYPQDVALNLKNLKGDASNLDWISMDSAIHHDDLNAVVELWGYFKSFSTQLMSKSALNAASLPRPHILEFLASLDSFWTVFRENLADLVSFSQSRLVMEILTAKRMGRMPSPTNRN